MPPFRALALLLLLAACARTTPPEMPAPPPAPVADLPPLAPGPGRQRALFDSFPESLLEAVEAACDDPGETLLTTVTGALRCEALPPPEIAASLILNYDGTVQDLPRFVLSFTTLARDGRYLVTSENYIRVPQRSGPDRQVRITDPGVESSMIRLLTAAGGVLVQDDD